GGMRVLQRKHNGRLISVGIGIGALAFLAPFGLALYNSAAVGSTRIAPSAQVIANLRRLDEDAMLHLMELSRRTTTLTDPEVSESAGLTIDWIERKQPGALIAR